MMPFVACALAIGGSMIAAMWISATSSTTIPIPVAPAAPAAPRKVVEAPKPPVPAPTPTNPPDPPPPEPIATKPVIDPRCIDWSHADGKPASCDRGSGFPAISGDGAQIVDAIVPDDGGRGFPGLALAFTDAKTAGTGRWVNLLSPGEYDPSKEPPSPALRATVKRRIEIAQRELDTGNYRSLRSLGETQTPETAVVSGDETQIHAEWSGSTLLVIDPAMSQPIGRHEFTGPHPSANEHCSYQLASIAAWWDPVARIAFGRMRYRSGDFCGDPTVENVFALTPRPAP